MKFPKIIGSVAGALICSVALCLLFGLVFWGVGWLADKVLPIITLIVGTAFWVLLIVGSPFLFFKKTRPWPLVGWVYWSYGLGLTLWLMCLVNVLQTWGVVAAIIGVMMAGVGVVFIAIIMALIKGMWGDLGS